MLNSYDDACSMNETHVFYSSTNTFRNPIFEPQIDYNDPSTCQDNKTGSSNNEALQQETCPNQQTNEETNSDQEHNFDGNKHVTFGWSHSNLNKLWQEFCEDLSYLISYRFFILEFNIKRHARIVRKYLDQRLSWIRPLIGQRNKCHNLRRRDRYDWNDEPSFDHLNKKHQIRQHEPSFAKGSKIAASLGDFQFPEPKSAKHLSTQRECLVKRLEQIKRHRLFDLESQFIASPEEQANNLSDYIDSLDDLNEYAGCRPTSAKKDPSEATNNVTSTELTSQILHQQDQSNLKQSSSFELVNDQLQMNISTTKSMLGPKRSTRSRWTTRNSRRVRDAQSPTFTGSKCIVCYEKTPNIITLPCKHTDVCSDCFVELILMVVKNKQYVVRCVLCRQKIESIRCMHRPHFVA